MLKRFFLGVQAKRLWYPGCATSLKGWSFPSVPGYHINILSCLLFPTGHLPIFLKLRLSPPTPLSLDQSTLPPKQASGMVQ
jgi:hypothetical protein